MTGQEAAHKHKWQRTEQQRQDIAAHRLHSADRGYLEVQAAQGGQAAGSTGGSAHLATALDARHHALHPRRLLCCPDIQFLLDLQDPRKEGGQCVTHASKSRSDPQAGRAGAGRQVMEASRSGQRPSGGAGALQAADWADMGQQQRECAAAVTGQGGMAQRRGPAGIVYS